MPKISDRRFILRILHYVGSRFFVSHYRVISHHILKPLAQRSSVNGFPQSRIDIAESEPPGSAQDAEIAKEH